MTGLLRFASARLDAVAHAGPFLEPGVIVAHAVAQRAADPVDLVDLGAAGRTLADDHRDGAARAEGRDGEGGFAVADHDLEAAGVGCGGRIGPDDGVAVAAGRFFDGDELGGVGSEEEHADEFHALQDRPDRPKLESGETPIRGK